VSRDAGQDDGVGLACTRVDCAVRARRAHEFRAG